MGRYIKGNVDEIVTLTTLGARTLVSAIFDDTVQERTLISSIEAVYTLTDLTPGSNIGPVMVGLAHSDYTDAEIQQVVDLVGGWDEGNLISQERARRKMRVIGVFSSETTNNITSLNDGKPLKTKLNWILNQGTSLRLWGYNLGTNAIATTVPDIHCQGHANLFPK